MSDVTNSASSGVSFGTLLSVLFIGLKLAKVINWSWWWVLSPIWIGWGLLIIVIILLLLITAALKS